MRIAMTFVAAFGVLAAAPLSSAAAANIDGTTIDLSAQQQQPDPKKKPPPRKPAAQPHQQRVQQQRPPQVRKPATVQQHHQNVQQRTTTKPTRTITTTTQQKNNLTTTRSRTVTTNNKPPRQVTFKANRPTVTVRARSWQSSGRYNFHGRNYSYWRGGPWRHRYGNSWRTYAAIGTLAAIAVGTATYYPYAYLDVPQDYCDGITEDGCQMSWEEVDTVEGGVAPACVTYCPWQ